MRTNDSNFIFRKVKSSFVTALCTLSILITVTPLFFIFFYALSRGVDALSIDFLTKMPKPVGETGGGMANALVGTGILLAIGSLVGLPTGIMTAFYLNAHRHTVFASVVRFLSDVLSGVPSIVVGVVAYVLIVLPMKHFSALAGGVALGILIIPIVVRTTEEMMRLVPSLLHEGALALGIPEWKATLRIIFPAALKGIATGILLALARAAGETAPLLFTALGNRFWSVSVLQPIGSLTVFIFDYAKAPFEDWNRQAWSAALVLIAFISILNLLFRWVTRRRYAKQ
jgi:phosphate transport system permease protein